MITYHIIRSLVPCAFVYVWLYLRLEAPSLCVQDKLEFERLRGCPTLGFEVEVPAEDGIMQLCGLFDYNW